MSGQLCIFVESWTEWIYCNSSTQVLKHKAADGETHSWNPVKKATREYLDDICVPGFKHIFWSVIVCVAMGCAAIFLYSNTIGDHSVRESL